LLWKSKIPKKCPETDDLFMRVSGPFPAQNGPGAAFICLPGPGLA